MATADIEAVQAAVQGNILDPYRLPCVRHVVVRVKAAAAARAALGAMIRPFQPGPTITSGAPVSGSPDGPCLNVGITYLGLASLGVPAGSLRTFPPEFRQGMTARAGRLGDTGASHPDRWVDGLREPGSAHLIFTIHAATSSAADAAATDVLTTGRGGFVEVGRLAGEALVELSTGGYGFHRERETGSSTTEKRVEHFGFRDGLSQPRFAGIGPSRRSPTDPIEPLGVVLLGHPTTSPVGVRVPQPHVLGHQGTFNAFRVLAQDVATFRTFITEEAARLGLSVDLLKAKICGRWPNGVPLSIADTAEAARRALDAGCDLNDFDFTDDQDGRTCPVGSHIRRSNPRAAHIVQRPSNRSRRLVRRGMPFGPWLPEGQQAQHRRERGLLGSFLCASLSTQFEALHFEWLNLGLQDPSITSTNDPLVGANGHTTSRFELATPDGGPGVVRGIPRFVETMGGAYCFLPSMEAITWIASAGWNLGTST